MTRLLALFYVLRVWWRRLRRDARMSARFGRPVSFVILEHDGDGFVRVDKDPIAKRRAQQRARDWVGS